MATPKTTETPLSQSEKKKTAESLAVRRTNDDAAVSKLSSVLKGYYQDEFLACFVRRQARRSPLINRGYYSRVAAMYKVVTDFVTACPELPRKQIVSLGAGFDTLYFRLHRDGKLPARYFEVDFPETMTRKAELIAAQPELANRMPSAPDTEPIYDMVSADLRDLKQLEETLVAAGLDFSLPTLFISECCLVYIEPEYSAALIEWGAQKFPNGGVFMVYEQIHPHDPFGRTMLKNLESRGSPLKSYLTYPTPQAHHERFLQLGWPHHAAWDMNQVYKRFLPREDVTRIERLEMFDEFEEWHMIQGHYCISLAARDPPAPEHKGAFSQLGFLSSALAKKESGRPGPSAREQAQQKRLEEILAKTAASASSRTDPS